MMKKDTRAFIDKMKKDDVFREKVLSVEDVSERLEFVRRQGFDSSPEELSALQKELEVLSAGGAEECTFCAPQHL